MLKVRRKVPRLSRRPIAQQMVRREKRAKSLRRLIFTTLTLVVLAVGAGAAYTWYMGTNVQANIEAAPKPKTRAIFKAPVSRPDATIGIAVQMISSPVAPGENASISIRTNPLTKCTIAVEYNKIPAKDSGLIQKTTDEFGTLSWAWTVAPNTPKGSWPISITCMNKKHSANVKATLEIKPSA